MKGVSLKGIKRVIGTVLGGDEEKDTDFIKAVEKFLEMKDHCKRYSGIFYLLSKLECTQTDFKILQEYHELIEFNRKRMFDDMDEDKLKHMVKINPIFNEEEQEYKVKFIRRYIDVKKSKLINTLLSTCSNLVQYRKYIENKNELNDKFITKSSIMTLEPVVDLNINFKLFYNFSTEERNRKGILLSLHKIYEVTKNMYDTHSKVDIDTETFVAAVKNAIEQLKKQIPRCDEAFDKILKSTEMLRENYSEYYKDFIGSGNSSIIAENFIQDVAGTVDQSPKLSYQFKQIIKQLRSLVQKAPGGGSQYEDVFKDIDEMIESDNEVEEVEEDEEDEEV